MCNSIISTDSAIVNVADNIANEELRAYTENLFTYGLDLRNAAKKIAATVAVIRDNAKTLCDEFEGDTPTKKFEKYGETILGIKRAQLNAFAKVGKELLTSEGESILHIPANSDDFTMSQLQALLPLPTDTTKQLAEDEIITPSMTVKEIKEVVKENDPKRDAKAKAKAKREKAKLEKKAKNNEVDGELVASINVYRLTSGEFIVALDGKDVTKTNLGKYLIKNLSK